MGLAAAAAQAGGVGAGAGAVVAKRIDAMSRREPMLKYKNLDVTRRWRRRQRQRQRWWLRMVACLAASLAV